MTIKTWEQRMPARLPEGALNTCVLQQMNMLAEIDDLRAELEKIKAQEPAGYFLQCGESIGWVEALEAYRHDDDVVPLYLAPGAQPVPEGMVLVPIDLTDAMLEKLAYMGRSRVVSGPNKSDWEPAAIRHWKAMLEAVKP